MAGTTRGRVSAEWSRDALVLYAGTLKMLHFNAY